MAGHSKWANIQHRKGRQDEKRGKAWTRVIREIMVAARLGGGDVAANPRSDHDFAYHPGPHLAALFILASFAVLNIGPFAVSCHAKSFKNSLRSRFNCTFWDIHDRSIRDCAT